MEYCGGGSVSDILRLRKNTLDEEEIVVILRDTLKGLEYLHTQRKIHRDVKCGNILLTTDGQAWFENSTDLLSLLSLKLSRFEIINGATLTIHFSLVLRLFTYICHHLNLAEKINDNFYNFSDKLTFEDSIKIETISALRSKFRYAVLEK